MMSPTARKLTASRRTDASSSDNWRTPQVVFDCVAKYAPIGLDPCTDETNPAGAREYLTAAMADVVKTWGGSWDFKLKSGECVWVNPPFSTKQQWIDLAITASQTAPVFVLCRVSHTARWWRQMVDASDVVMYWRKRLQFIDPVNACKAAAPFDTAIFGLNVSYKRCAAAFDAFVHMEICR